MIRVIAFIQLSGFCYKHEPLVMLRVNMMIMKMMRTDKMSSVHQTHSPCFFPVALIWSGFSGKSLDRWETGFDCQLGQEVAFHGRLCRFTWFLSTIINACDVVVNVKAGLMDCRGSMLLLLHLYAWEACFYLSGLFVCLLIVWTKRETDRRLLPPWCNRLVVKSRSKQRCCQSSQTDQAQMLHFSVCLSFCLFVCLFVEFPVEAKGCLSYKPSLLQCYIHLRWNFIARQVHITSQGSFQHQT